MTARVITDPSALGWVLDPDTGRWEWSGSGGGGSGGGGAWEYLERVDVAGADTAEVDGIGYDYAAYKVIFSGVYSNTNIKSLQMQFLVDGVADTAYHSSLSFAGDNNLNPPYGGSDDVTGGKYIELAAFNNTTGFGFAIFSGEVSIYVPDISQAEIETWGRGTKINVISTMTSENKEFRHAGGFSVGSKTNFRNITGLHFTGKDGKDGPISPFAGGSIHLLGFKGGRD